MKTSLTQPRDKALRKAVTAWVRSFGAFCPLGPIRLIRERATQVVLGRGPVLRQQLVRVNFQDATVGDNRLGQKFGASCPLGPSRLIRERETQVVLDRGPGLRQLLTRPDFQGPTIVVGNRLR
jgi:hypothetical protein